MAGVELALLDPAAKPPSQALAEVREKDARWTPAIKVPVEVDS